MRYFIAAAVAVCLFAGGAWGQSGSVDEGGWRSPDEAPARFTPDTSEPGSAALVSGAEAGGVAQFTRGSGTLPNNHGQVWREYDISPYTSHVSDVEHPEKALVDWILRDTGSDVWFSSPLGILSASRDTLRVYHTPEMQGKVANIVDRFVHSAGEPRLFSLRTLSVGNPNWRVKALPRMRSVTVQTAGVEGWLVSKEDATLILADLSRRNDYREHNSPNLLIPNGQSQLITLTQPVEYPKSLLTIEDAVRGGQTVERGQINEGFTLQFSPLLSLDGSIIDAVIKCEVNQIERFVPLTVDIPSGVQQQRVQLQVPQMTSWRIHERFRWPAGQVLLISCGMVATPSPGSGGSGALSGLLTGNSDRADVLLFIEEKGPARTTLESETASSQTGDYNNRGRY